MRTDSVFHKYVEGSGRLRHFPEHEPAVPRTAALFKDAAEERPDERTEPLVRRDVSAKPHVRRVFLKGAAVRVFQDRDIQPLLIAEMVVYRRDIGACALTNIPDGGIMKPIFGKALSSGLKEALGSIGAKIIMLYFRL